MKTRFYELIYPTLSNHVSLHKTKVNVLGNFITKYLIFGNIEGLFISLVFMLNLG